MSSECRVIFLRHGETDYNHQSLFAGSSDVPLNKNGIIQAKSAAASLNKSTINEIWCSPLLRARETAEIVANHIGLKVKIFSDLAERDYGDWEGLSKKTVNRDLTPPNGDSLSSFEKRVSNLVQSIIVSKASILIVSHSGVFQAIIKQHPQSPIKLSINNGEITCIKFST